MAFLQMSLCQMTFLQSVVMLIVSMFYVVMLNVLGPSDILDIKSITCVCEAKTAKTELILVQHLNIKIAFYLISLICTPANLNY
jgi:hypothetical protein